MASQSIPCASSKLPIISHKTVSPIHILKIEPAPVRLFLQNEGCREEIYPGEYLNRWKMIVRNFDTLQISTVDRPFFTPFASRWKSPMISRTSMDICQTCPESLLCREPHIGGVVPLNSRTQEDKCNNAGIHIFLLVVVASANYGQCLKMCNTFIRKYKTQDF